MPRLLTRDPPEERAALLRNSGRWFLPTLLASAAALRLCFAWICPAFLTGDDLEIVETAARDAIGLDYVPWAIRSLFHPVGLVLPVVKVGVLAGLRSPRSITFLACVPTIFFSVLSILILYGIARQMDLPTSTARVAAFLFAFHWLPLTYGSTQYPRPISTCLLLGAFWFAQRPDQTYRQGVIAGSLVAMAFAVRWSEGVFLIPLLIVCAWTSRSWKTAAAIVGGFLLGTLLCVGLFDWLTLGVPFASLRAYAAFAQNPELAGPDPRPWYWYASMALQWGSPVAVFLAVPGVRDPKSRQPLVVLLSVAVLLSFSPLKQMRYLQMCVPFLALAAALGWQRLADGGARLRWLSTAALVLAVPLGLERTVHVLRRKSLSAIAAVQSLSALNPPIRTVALEQAWAYGERLYLGNGVSVRNIAPQRPLSPETVGVAAASSDAIAVYEEDSSETVRRILSDAGFRTCGSFTLAASPTVTVYARTDHACGD